MTTILGWVFFSSVVRLGVLTTDRTCNTPAGCTPHKRPHKTRVPKNMTRALCYSSATKQCLCRVSAKQLLVQQCQTVPVIFKWTTRTNTYYHRQHHVMTVIPGTRLITSKTMTVFTLIIMSCLSTALKCLR